MNATSKPTVFLLGPSGSGKTRLSEWLDEDLRFLRIEIDCWPEGDGIDLAGLRKEWDAFLGSGNVRSLAAAIGTKVRAANRQGAVLSFPSTFVLPTALAEAAEAEGVRIVILYGTGAHCLAAFLRRELELGRGLDADHWIANNAQTYAQISRPEYAKYRLNAFTKTNHRRRVVLVADMKRRIIG